MLKNSKKKLLAKLFRAYPEHCVLLLTLTSIFSIIPVSRSTPLTSSARGSWLTFTLTRHVVTLCGHCGNPTIAVLTAKAITSGQPVMIRLAPVAQVPFHVIQAVAVSCVVVTFIGSALIARTLSAILSL
jgi:hypothetical protein